MTLAADPSPAEADPAGAGAGPHQAAALDALCRTARALFGAAAAAITLGGTVAASLALADDDTREGWLPLCAGLPPIDEDGEVVVADALEGVPAVRFVASIRFAAHARLSVFDTRERSFTAVEKHQLRDLAAIADHLLQLEARMRAAEQQEEHFRLLAENSTDTIVRGSLDGVRRYISPAVRELLGYEPEELVGRRAVEISHPNDIARMRDLFQQFRDGTATRGHNELRQRHKNGSWVWLEAHLRVTRDKQTGQPDGYVASVRNLDNRKAIEARLEHMATHDELTGLPNRKLFREHLAAAIAETRSGGRRFALLWMDLDRFKDINDSLGHQAGDAVLTIATRRFAAVIRPGDMVARLGGDEFALIAPIGSDNAVAGQIASRLVAAMAAPIHHGGEAITAGVSIGIACTPEAGGDPDELLAAADNALYAAKSSGRGSYCFCSASRAPD